MAGLFGSLDNVFPDDVGGQISLILRASKFAEESQRCTFDWEGNTGIHCTAGKSKFGRVLDLTMGGFNIERSVELTVLVENLPSADPENFPEPNDEITVYLSEDDPGKNYCIMEVQNQYNAELTLKCVDTRSL